MNLNLIKNIAFIFFSICFLFSFCQHSWTEGKLLLKNGDTLTGLIQFPMDKAKIVSLAKQKVKFKEDYDEIIYTYDRKQVDKIYCDTYDEYPGHYEYARLKNGKYRIFKVLISGNVSLYYRKIAIQIDENTFFDPNNPGVVYYQEEYYEEIDEYYVKRYNEKKVTPLISHYAFKSFKGRILKYFSDCQDIIDLINEDLYTEDDIALLVNDYNLFCND